MPEYTEYAGTPEGGWERRTVNLPEPGRTRCQRCGAEIDPALGAESPTGEWTEGTADDPRAPGDRDDICDKCEWGNDR